PLGPAPPGQGCPARLGGREVLLRGRGPGRSGPAGGTARGAAGGTDRAAPAAAQGDGRADRLRGPTRDRAGDRVQAERRGLQGGPGRGVGRRLAAPPVSPATGTGVAEAAGPRP